MIDMISFTCLQETDIDTGYEIRGACSRKSRCIRYSIVHKINKLHWQIAFSTKSKSSLTAHIE